jgi:hypothetical protein
MALYFSSLLRRPHFSLRYGLWATALFYIPKRISGEIWLIRVHKCLSCGTMYSTPSKNVTPGAYTTPTTMPLKGLFIDGVWHCELKVEVVASVRLIIRIGNCKPPRQASHLQVRKDSPNKDRWFYICRKPKEVGCNFFLWESAAASRESRTALSNSKSESVPVESAASYADSPDKRIVEGRLEAGDKWMDGMNPEKGEEFGERSLTAKDEISALGRTNESRYLNSYLFSLSLLTTL